jgi:hypothetical protein
MSVGFIGAVVDPIDAERSSVYGVTFALGSPSHFVTADHVIEAAHERGSEGRLHVLGPGMDPAAVSAIHRHPTMDLAVLGVEGAEVEPFREVGVPQVGETAYVYGVRGGRPEVRAVAVQSGARMLHTVSTPLSRGTDPAPAEARELLYAQPAFAIDAELDHGFSGSAVYTAERVLGVCTVSGLIDGRWIGLPLQLADARDWLLQTIHGSEAVA